MCPPVDCVWGHGMKQLEMPGHAQRETRPRHMCILECEIPAPAGIRDVSARGAFLETNARPEPGSVVTLRHPHAGAIRGEVVATGRDGIQLAFNHDPRALGFALAALTA